MTTTCGILIGRLEICGAGEEIHLECLRPENHDGPHLILGNEGKYVIWKDDMCSNWKECEGCSSVDSNDWCIAYGRVDKETAKKMISDESYNVG